MRVALYLKNLDEEYQISIFKGIRFEATRIGIDLFCIQGELSQLDRYIPVDGILLLSSVLFTQEKGTDISGIKTFFGQTPCISIGNRLEGIPSIIIRNKKSMEKLMEHLIIFHGYRKLLYIGGPSKHRDNIVRENVFNKTIKKYQINFPELEGSITNGGFSESSAIYILKDYIKTNPNSPLDAVIAANDNMAIGALKVLRSIENKQWKSCVVTGFDDIPQACLEIPFITTVHQPLHELGQLAVKSIHKLIEQKRIPQIVHLDSTLIIRNSCGCKLGKSNKSPISGETPLQEATINAETQLSLLQYQTFRSENYLRNVSTFGQQLTKTDSLHELVSLLQVFLNNNYVNTFFLLLYPQKKGPSNGEIYLIYQRFMNEESINIDKRKKTTLVKFFDNDFRHEKDSPASTCIFNLTSGTEELGLIVYETDDNTHPHICSAAVFIGNTIKRLLVLKDEKDRSRKLEEIVQLRTRDLVESNRELKKEAKRRLTVEAEVLHISEMERLRFSLDLHDDICQRLAGISMFSKSLKKGSDLQELSEMIDETLLRTRQYAHDSFPVELDSLGLKEAFESLCRATQKQSSCICDYSWNTPFEINLTEPQKLNLYRIIQEAIHNTIKHANATHIQISVTLKDGALVTLLRDNGRGIAYLKGKNTQKNHNKKEHIGIGLKSMEYRAHQIGAEYQFSSSAKKGTFIKITLPL